MRAWVVRPAALGLALSCATIACDLTERRGDGSGARNDAQMDQHAGQQMDAYTWSASNSAPSGCPMWFVGGDFLINGGARSVYVPRATILHPGWGEVRSAQALDGDKQPAPDSLDVLFYSYLDDTIYRGTFALPRDSIARVLRDGYPTAHDRSGRAAFDQLVVGVAPGGAVAVWAAGQDRQVEVFFGQAQAVDLDWHRTLEIPSTVDRKPFVARALAESAKGDTLVPRMMRHVPLGRWAAYRTRYRWRPAFEGVPATDPKRIVFVNGEFIRTGLPFDATAPVGVPVPSGRPR